MMIIMGVVGVIFAIVVIGKTSVVSILSYYSCACSIVVFHSSVCEIENRKKSVSCLFSLDCIKS